MRSVVHPGINVEKFQIFHIVSRDWYIIHLTLKNVFFNNTITASSSSWVIFSIFTSIPWFICFIDFPHSKTRTEFDGRFLCFGWCDMIWYSLTSDYSKDFEDLLSKVSSYLTITQKEGVLKEEQRPTCSVLGWKSNWNRPGICESVEPIVLRTHRLHCRDRNENVGAIDEARSLYYTQHTAEPSIAAVPYVLDSSPKYAL